MNEQQRAFLTADWNSARSDCYKEEDLLEIHLNLLEISPFLCYCVSFGHPTVQTSEFMLSFIRAAD